MASMLRSLRDPLFALFLLSGCNAEPAAPSAPAAVSSRPQVAPAAGTAPASVPAAAATPTAPETATAPLASPEEPKPSAKLAFKPDPYAGGPALPPAALAAAASPSGCISEPLSLVKDTLLLTVRIRLVRDPGGAIALVDPVYQVSDSTTRPAAPTEATPGIPRLELVHADGSVHAVDFRGQYASLHDVRPRLTRDEPPPDPTWVKAWFASAPIGADVVAHRVSLDGRVLSEVKRPKAAPLLSNIRCAEGGAGALTLSWRTHSDDAQAPLLVDVLRSGPVGMIEALPLSDARKVEELTVSGLSHGAEQDAVLLVSVTDTFRLVSRSVLVPRKAL
jgi:hypothetical protein